MDIVELINPRFMKMEESDPCVADQSPFTLQTLKYVPHRRRKSWPVYIRSGNDSNDFNLPQAF